MRGGVLCQRIADVIDRALAVCVVPFDGPRYNRNQKDAGMRVPSCVTPGSIGDVLHDEIRWSAGNELCAPLIVFLIFPRCRWQCDPHMLANLRVDRARGQDGSEIKSDDWGCECNPH